MTELIENPRSCARFTATMPADQITYNVILLLALFASNDSPWRMTNVRGLAIALVILFVSHCIGLLIEPIALWP